MKIELKSLDLVHFKCFPKLHLDFHEGVNNIYGENAAGKTSVYDALTWLLFNKDSAGNARPDIKPHHAPAGTMPEVTAVLEVDGEDKPRWLSSRRFTVSLHERAALFQMLTAWRGKALTDAELDPAGDGFDLMQMAGVPAMLSVTVVEKDDGSKYNRIEAVTGFPKGLPAPQPESEILVFDADEPDMEVFGKLPEWVQDIIRKSTQFADNAPEEKVDIPPEEPETPPDSKGACPI